MGKLFRIVALAMLVVAITAGGAMAASSLSVTSRALDYKLTTNGTFTVSSTTVSGLSIGFTPGLNLSVGDNVRFTLTNAKFKAGERIYLMSASSSGNASGAVATATDTIDIPVETPSPINVPLYLTTRIGEGGPNGAPPSIVVNQSLTAGSNVTIQGFAQNNVGTTYTQGTAPAASLLTTTTAGTATMTFSPLITAADRTIDVNQGRLKFVTNSATTVTITAAMTNPDSGLTTGLIGFSDSTVGFGYTLTVAGDLTGISTIKIGTNAAVSITTAMRSASLAEITGATSGTVPTLTAATNIVFTVDGATVLSGRELVLSFKITTAKAATNHVFASATGDIPMVITNTTANPSTFTWLVNGYQAIVPYNIANTAYTTICIVNNPTNLTADVYADVMNAQSFSAAFTGLSNLSSVRYPRTGRNA